MVYSIQTTYRTDNIIIWDSKDIGYNQPIVLTQPDSEST